MRSWSAPTEADTFEVGRLLAGELRPDLTLLLSGQLGAGKTVVARGVAAGLGLDPSEVQSPTFVLMREHGAGERLMIHVDLYRLEGPEEIAAAGIDEALEGPGVKVVEWGERLGWRPPGAIALRIELSGRGGRSIVETPGPEGGGGAT